MDISYQEELFRTPEILARVMKEGPEPALLQARRIVFCGCGTSLYIGGQLAELCLRAGREACAADAVRLWERPAPREGDIYIYISRSGNSQETVLAQERMKGLGAESFYLGCAPESRLDRSCDHARVLPYANETNILESFSFYAQLLLGGLCFGLEADPGIPETVASALERGREYGRVWTESRQAPSRILSLGAPLYLPLQREMMLKDGEITGLPVESWGNLEFRHGPRSWADETTLIHFMPGQGTREWDRNAAAELADYGCPVLYYGEDAPEGTVPAPTGAGSGSLAEVLAAAAFHTALSTEIGKAHGTRPEALRHVVHNVSAL